MNFGEILDAVCKDGISANRRGDAKTWVQARHAWLWGAQPWTFKNAVDAIVFTANQQVAAAPVNLHAVYAVYDSQGAPLTGIRDLRKFFDEYNTLAGLGSGPPEAYTVVNGQVLVGPQGDGNTGQIVYQREKPTLANDADATGLPDGFDLALVLGGRATGFKLTNVPLSETLDADFSSAVTAMENDWLDSVLETGGQIGAFRPGAQSPAWR